MEIFKINIKVFSPLKTYNNLGDVERDSKLFYSLWVFHWTFIGFWVIARLPRSPGRFSVFWPISTMLHFERFRFFLWCQTFNLLSNPLGIVPSATTIGITVIFMVYVFFLVLWQGPSTCLSFRFLLFLLCGSPARQSSLFNRLPFLFVNKY